MGFGHSPDGLSAASPDGAEVVFLRLCHHTYVASGAMLFSNWEMAVTSCARANGFVSMMLFGTPFDAHSSACAPLIYTMGKLGFASLNCAATSQPLNRPFKPTSVTSAL